MKKLMIMVLACFFAVSTTVNAQLINPGDEPMLISEPEISDEEFEAILMEMEELEAMQPDPEDYMKIYMSNYDAAMAWAFENNILTGDGETGDLRPYDCVKRAEFLKMLYNVLKVDTTDAKGELFTDTPSDQWYINFVRKAREKGTIEGYSDGSFRPGTCVNRAEAIKIAFLEFPEINPVATAIDYDDVPETEWYYKYVSYALANNLVGTRHIYYLKVYNPGVAMTRDEFAEMLYRLKTVQDNNLDSYDDYYAPNNIEPVEVKDYDLEPEEFFEYGTSLLMTVDTHNQNQIDQLDSFLAMTPAKSVDHYMGELFESIEDEIAPAFDVGTEIMFGAGDPSNGSAIESLVFTVDNPTKLNAAFDSLAKKPDFSKGTLFGFNTFDNRADGTFYAYTDEVMATWPTPADRYRALQNIYNNEKDLLDNAEYTNYVASIPTKGVGTVYFNSTYGESGILAVVPHSNGFKVHYRLDGVGDGGATEPPYMYQNIPGENVMFYGESNALLDIYNVQGMDLASQLKTEGAIETEGNWMNNGIAFSMHDTGTLLPGMALYFDAADYVEDARQDIAAMSEFFDAIVAQMDEESPEMADVITKSTVDADGATLNKITFDLSAVPEEEMDSDLEMFNEIVTDPIEFYYGLTSDDYVVFALYNDFEEVLADSRPISMNSDIKEAMSYLSGYPNGLTYISMENMLNYVDIWVTELEKQEPMPAELKDNYNQVIEYLSTIDYMINSEKEFGNGLMYVKVN